MIPINVLREIVYTKFAESVNAWDEKDCLDHFTQQERTIPDGADLESTHQLIKDLEWSYIEQASEEDLKTVYPEFFKDALWNA